MTNLNPPPNEDSMDKPVELKSCPFCGAKPRLGRFAETQVVHENVTCPARTGVRPTTLEAWNTRDASQAQTIDRLERRVEDLRRWLSGALAVIDQAGVIWMGEVSARAAHRNRPETSGTSGEGDDDCYPQKEPK